MMLKVGLFGGSFNPAHEGHKMVAQCGLRDLGLDEVWWLVSPGNPLKKSTNNYEARVASVEALGLPRDMKISHIERDYGTRYTVDMLAKLFTRHADKQFVWMMGADNLSQMPKWKEWQVIMHSLPIAIIARPGKGLKPRLGQVARQYSGARIDEQFSHKIAEFEAPAWVYLTPPLNAQSSTKIRAAKTQP